MRRIIFPNGVVKNTWKPFQYVRGDMHACNAIYMGGIHTDTESGLVVSGLSLNVMVFEWTFWMSSGSNSIVKKTISFENNTGN